MKDEMEVNESRDEWQDKLKTAISGSEFMRILRRGILKFYYYPKWMGYTNCNSLPGSDDRKKFDSRVGDRNKEFEYKYPLMPKRKTMDGSD